MQYIRNVLVALCFLLISGCGILDYFFLPSPDDTAQELYEQANDAMRAKEYMTAAACFQKIKDNFPFSPYTIEAELSLGDAYFLDEDYTTAVEAYKEFEDMHPGHEAIPYVLYQIGLSSLKSFISIDRPTTMVDEALEYFHRLQEMYPESEYAARVGEQIKECRTLLAEHELYLGDVFWHMENYGAAWRRYQYILENFPDVPTVYQHAEEKSVAAYYRFREQKSDETREQIQGTWKDWFSWM